MKYFDPGDYTNSGFYIPDNLELNWNYCDNTVYYPTEITGFLERIKPLPGQTVVIWGAANRLTNYAGCIEAVNQYAAQIPNCVIVFDGNYSTNNVDARTFTYAQIPYFEHVARCTWDQVELPATRTKTFMMIGTKDYPTRKYLLSRIVAAGADADALISYKQINSNGINLMYYTQHQIDAINQVADQVNSRLPWPVLDRSIEFPQMPRQFLLDTYINLVTDTFFEGDVFVSEKVYTAMAHGQIFVMLAPCGTLAYLRSQGYRTFGDYIDESYDAIQDNYARLQTVADLIINLSQQDLADLATQCQEVLLHNYNTFYQRNVNDQFLKRLT